MLMHLKRIKGPLSNKKVTVYIEFRPFFLTAFVCFGYFVTYAWGCSYF